MGQTRFQADIGDKIKRLRQQRNMTQSELAGDQITRNMLSRVENGAALPSLPTIWYLAQRLNVPAGFLLADGDDDRIWSKMNRIVTIRRVLRNGDHRICLALCRESGELGEADDEIHLIMAQCSLALATEELHLGNLHAACAALDGALDSAEHTVYDTQAIRATAALYLRFLRTLSPTLYTETELATDDLLMGSSDPFARYILAREALDAMEHRRVEAYLASGPEGDIWRAHLLAHRDMLSGQYETAQRTLYSLLHAETARSEMLLYCVFCDLEVCCRETGDYRGAYEYSQNKVAQLEKMLQK